MFMLQVSAQNRYVFKPVTVSINLDADDINRGNNFESVVQVPVYKVDTYISYEPRTCYRVICSDFESSLNSDWGGFFSTKNPTQKAKILAEQIKGIGQTTAERIVKYNLIEYRPRTWSAFSRVINYSYDFLKDKGFSYNFATSVLEQYGDENAKNLGYYNSNNCHSEPYTCQVPVEREIETFAYNMNKNLKVNVAPSSSSAYLYSFEKEYFNIRISGEGNDASISQTTDYNNYSINQVNLKNSDNIEFNFLALYRNLVHAPIDIAQINSSLNSEGLTISFDANNLYRQVFEQSNDVEVSYRVCLKGWMFKTCKRTIQSGNIDLSTRKTSVIIPASNFVRGQKYFVDYEIKMNSSSHFKTGTVYSDSLETFKF